MHGRSGDTRDSSLQATRACVRNGADAQPAVLWRGVIAYKSKEFRAQGLALLANCYAPAHEAAMRGRWLAAAEEALSRLPPRLVALKSVPRHC